MLVPGVPPGAQHHLASLCEFDRIAGQIGEDLAQIKRIAVKNLRQVVVDQAGDLEPLGGGTHSHHAGDALDNVLEIEIDDLELDFAGFDLREVENIVDHIQQSFSGLPRHLRIVALFRVELGIGQEPYHPDHAIERRADLVAHDAQEFGLGSRRRLGRVLGQQQRIRHPVKGLLSERSTDD